MSEFPFADEFGPARVEHLYEPSIGLQAVVVVDNVAAGPSIGGVRMAPDVSARECFRLARAMTWKNAAAGLAHGGGKSVIFADPGMPIADKERLVRAFAALVHDVHDYIPGPDMGTDETCMAWVRDEIGRAVGLPRALGGIPLDEIGATGFGLAIAVDVAAAHCGLELNGARIAVQGFGAVGKHAARFLAERGTVLVAAADIAGTIADPNGLDVAALIAVKAGGGRVVDAPFGEKLAREAVLDVDCDILIPAARPDILTVDNAKHVRARLVAQGANIPASVDAEHVLYERGILSLPDFIANAGGVICAAVEYHGGSEAAAFAEIEDKISRNVATVLERSRDLAVPPRSAAQAMAEERVRAAMGYRRWR
ncbi:MAG TPA: Glu/Leu/Phe/Val dehydrogenase [Acidimicrobiia bacterium]|nr:Glu/Leu/Phe/Val dehydrogenase [Acidimicrobiia bacterium]